MIDDTPPPAPGKTPARDTRPAAPARTGRDARLKAALKANLTRRKAQNRARKTPSDPKD